jgi:hypothetical protein
LFLAIFCMKWYVSKYIATYNQSFKICFKILTRNVPSYDDYGTTSDQNVTKSIILWHFLWRHLILVTYVTKCQKKCHQGSQILYRDNLYHVIEVKLQMPWIYDNDGESQMILLNFLTIFIYAGIWTPLSGRVPLTLSRVGLIC